MKNKIIFNNCILCNYCFYRYGQNPEMGDDEDGYCKKREISMESDWRFPYEKTKCKEFKCKKEIKL